MSQHHLSLRVLTQIHFLGICNPGCPNHPEHIFPLFPPITSYKSVFSQNKNQCQLKNMSFSSENNECLHPCYDQPCVKLRKEEKENFKLGFNFFLPFPPSFFCRNKKESLTVSPALDSKAGKDELPQEMCLVLSSLS